MAKVIDPAIDFTQQTAPAAPAAGRTRMYAKADGLLYVQLPSGEEFSLMLGFEDRAPGVSATVPAGYSLVVAGDFELASGVVYELAADATMEIL